MEPLITIPALGDNLIHLYRYSADNALVVDPGQSRLVLEFLNTHNLNLTTILLTHGHGDHTGGASQLKAVTNAEVIGPKPISSLDRPVHDGDIITLDDKTIKVIAAPGHTRNSLCYYMEPTTQDAPIIFTGDTMFIAGCGRIFEATAEAMYKSLTALAQLPDETVVCCGHDYTVENYEFALTIEPDNEAVKKLLDKAGQSSVSRTRSTILQERQTNPFLRADSPSIRAALNMPAAEAFEVFAELRRRKDFF